jgi:hypothetical protein
MAMSRKNVRNYTGQNAELTNGGLITKALWKAQDVVNCDNVKKAPVLAV